MHMWYFARICAHARSWCDFAKCRFAHFPSFFSVHVDTYALGQTNFIVNNTFSQILPCSVLTRRYTQIAHECDR